MQFNSLPPEIHLALSEYLSPLDIISVSHTGSFLRSLYSPLAYRRCLLIPRDRNARFPSKPIDTEYSTIPARVLMEPSRYSWFPNKHVQVLVCMDYCVLRLLDNYQSDYLQHYPTLDALHVVTSKKHLRDDYEHSLYYTPFTIDMCVDFAHLIRSVPHIYMEIFSSEFIHILSVLENPQSLRSLDICREVKDLGDEVVGQIDKFTNLEKLRIFPNTSWDATDFALLFSKLSSLERLHTLTTVHGADKNSLKTITLVPKTVEYHKVVIYKPVEQQDFFGWWSQRNGMISQLINVLGVDPRNQTSIQHNSSTELNQHENNDNNDNNDNNTDNDNNTGNTDNSDASIPTTEFPNVTNLYIESSCHLPELDSFTFPGVKQLTLRGIDKDMNLSTLIPKINLLTITSLSLSFNGFSGAVEAIHHLPQFQQLKRFALEPWSPDVAIIMKSRIMSCPVYNQLLLAARMVLHVTGDHFVSSVIELDAVPSSTNQGSDEPVKYELKGPVCLRFIEALVAVGYRNVADLCGLSREESFSLVHDLINNPEQCLAKSSSIFDIQLAKTEAPTKDEVFTCMRVLLAMIETTLKNLIRIPTLEYVDFSNVADVMNSPRLRVMVETHPTIKQLLLHKTTDMIPYPEYTQLVNVVQPTDLSRPEKDYEQGIKACYVVDAQGVRTKHRNFTRKGISLDYQEFSFRAFNHSDTHSKWVVNDGWENTNLEFDGWI